MMMSIKMKKTNVVHICMMGKIKTQEWQPQSIRHRWQPQSIRHRRQPPPIIAVEYIISFYIQPSITSVIDACNSIGLVS